MMVVDGKPCNYNIMTANPKYYRRAEIIAALYLSHPQQVTVNKRKSIVKHPLSYVFCVQLMLFSITIAYEKYFVPAEVHTTEGIK
jgi:hypothetical protein